MAWILKWSYTRWKSHLTQYCQKFIAFPLNAKSFAIACCFFFSFFITLFQKRTGKKGFANGVLLIVTQGACDPCRPMYFRDKLVMEELSEHMNVINVFHDVNSTFYKVPRIHRNPGFFELIIVFVVYIEPYSR